jgi:zinc transporter
MDMAIDRLKPALTADVPGCTWILRFDAAGRAEPGAAEDFARLGQLGEGFVWAHLDLADMRSKALADRLTTLTDEARETLFGVVDHQFVHHGGKIVSGAILDHERGLAGRSTRMDFLRFAFGDGFLISARKRPLHAAEETRVALSGGRLTETPLALFEEIVERVCEGLVAHVGEVSAALDRMEEHIVEGRWRDERGALGPARRSALRLARQINGLRTILQRLESAASEPEHVDLRDAASRLAQRTDSLQHDVSGLQDRARLLQDELNAALGHETDDRLYLLTVVTTLMLPATFVTGYFGMNTKNLLFSENEYGSIYATLLCGLASLSVFLFMRRRGLTRPSGEDAEPGAIADKKGRQSARVSSDSF